MQDLNDIHLRKYVWITHTIMTFSWLEKGLL